MNVRIQLLGPLRVWRDGHELDLGGPMQRAVMALLSAYAASGRSLSMQELVDALWEEDPPASAQNVIHTYIKRLRRLLEPERPARAPSRLLRRVGKGYTLDLSSVELDLARFQLLLRGAGDAERAGDQRRVADRLGEALALWRGPLLADMTLLSGHPRLVALPGERWSAVARYGEAMLAIGKAAAALPALEEAAAACPLDEPARARLIRCYDSALLAKDTHSAGDPVARSLAAAAQLPADIPAYAARAGELRRLDSLLAGASQLPAVTMALIHGTAGAGKTTLAIHWAHQVAGRFPDGQLFVNLNGFDPAGSVVDPATALRILLDALGVPPQRIPAGIEAQVDLYRRLLAGRRVLIVLDNARDAEQVRPLLPNSAGCFVLLTSRNQLPGLVATHGAHPVRLDPLSAGDAWRLLERRLGAGRMATDEAAVAEIIARCAGLPLALAIVAARAAANPEFSLDALARELGEGLDGWASGDSTADVRVAFASSYRQLDPRAARLFRLLGGHPGPEVGIAAAASLTGLAVGRVRPLLAELTQAHLVAEPVPGRYALHDLLRAYANELAATVDQEADRHAALHRLLDHYALTADSAAELLAPTWEPIAAVPPSEGVSPERLAELGQARGWLATEHPVLLRAIELARIAGFDRHALALASSLQSFLEWRGLRQEQVTVQNAALAAAQRITDRRLIARCHRVVAVAEAQLGRRHEAGEHLQRALALYGGLGDRVGQASTHFNLAWLSDQEGRHEEAFVHRRQALELYRAAGHQNGAASTLGAIGWGHEQIGNYREALTCCEEALVLLTQLGERHWQAVVLDTTGNAHHHLGDHDQARRSYERALALFRQLGDRTREAETLTHLGTTWHAAGGREQARAAWQSALAILDEFGHPDADPVRAMLASASVGGRPAGGGAERYRRPDHGQPSGRKLLVRPR